MVSLGTLVSIDKARINRMAEAFRRFAPLRFLWRITNLDEHPDNISSIASEENNIFIVDWVPQTGFTGPRVDQSFHHPWWQEFH